jgi:phospholipase D1/2
LFIQQKKWALIDTQARRNKRKVTAFVGGLDLCDVSCDTLDISGTVFENDYSQTFLVMLLNWFS